MRPLVFCVLLAQAATQPTMPPQPDFSGRWTLVAAVPSGTNVAKALDVRQLVMRATPRGQPIAPTFSTIEIDRQLDAGMTTETHWIGIVGGAVGGIVGSNGNQRDAAPRTNSSYSVKWDGATLAFEDRTYTGDEWQPREWTERRERWALQPNGEVAIDIATTGSADRPHSISAVYRRRE